MIKSRAYEWPTLALYALTYLVWVLTLFYHASLGAFISVGLLTLCLALHSSLQHETIHILEPRLKGLAPLLASPALGVFIPYLRFRDTHLAHHKNENLTDPYDDPETYYMADEVWQELPNWKRKILLFNNTLLGRMSVGPIIGQCAFMACDLRLILGGDWPVLRAWLIHLISAALIVWLVVSVFLVSIVTYLVACYLALSVLKIRTFLEHQADMCAQNRTVIITDKSPLSFLFLNNNLHAVHHQHPSVSWYNLPAKFSQDKDRYLPDGTGYYFTNYRTIFARYFLRRKETVSHPFWSLKNRNVR